MARPENVRVEYSVEATVNTGNFTNVRPGYRISADVPEGDHPDTTRAQLKGLADRWLEEDVDKVNEELNS